MTQETKNMNETMKPEQVSQHMRNVAASANAKIQLLEEKTWDMELK
jgi:hypothetical protein